MKKLFTAVLIILVALVSLSAEFSSKTDSYFRYSKPFLTSREYRIEHGLFENPATLANGKFQFSIPVSITGFNAGKTLANFANSGSLKERAVDYLKTAAFNVPVGYSTLADANVGLFLGFKGFAVGAYTAIDVDAQNKNSSISLTPVADAGFAIGYGRRVYDKNVSIDVGLSAHADATMLWDKTISTSELDEFSLDKSVFNDINVLTQFSVDAGTSVGLYNDALKINVAATDIKVGKLKKYNVGVKALEPTTQEEEKLVNQKFKLSAGALYTLKFNKSEFGFSADVKDILTIDYSAAKTILGHLNLRATANMFKLVKASAALCGGDLELGLGLNLFGNEINAVYKVVEAGEDFGQKTVDTFTIKCRIGFDKN